MDSFRAGEGFLGRFWAVPLVESENGHFQQKKGQNCNFSGPANGCLKRSAKMAKFTQKRSVLQKGCQCANNLACKCEPLPFRAIKIDTSRLLAQR